MKYKQILAVVTFGLVCSACSVRSPASVEEVAAGPPLLITHHQKSATTSTGGVGHKLEFINPTNHTYQQVVFVFIPYDRFGPRKS